MDERIQATAVTAAQRLLCDYRAEHPDWTNDKTPVDALVASLGLDIATFHPNDYEPGTYGYLEPHENLIWLCRDLSPALRRFTLAHELGHAVLHRSSVQSSSPPTNTQEDPCQQPDIQEEVAPYEGQNILEEVLGIGQSYDPRSERELAANIFAAELLMPLERVRTLFLDQRVSPRTLASLFDVSNAAMLNRLVGLVTERENNGATPFPTGDASVPAPHPFLSRPYEMPATPAKPRYDEYQKAAIEAATPALIVAGPGSGKTSTLIGRTDYLINVLGVPAENILALTFSRKAAQEMQERLQGILPTHSETNIAQPKVSTFHAFCADVLRRYDSVVGLRSNFALIDETEGYFLLRQLTREMRLSHYRNLKAPAFYFPDILRAISRAKDELVTPERYRELAEAMLETAQQAQDEEAMLAAHKALEIAHIYALYDEALQQRGDTDFGGLLMLTVQLFQDFPEFCYEQQQKFQHILVDEFQDINRASGVLLRLLAGERQQVWVVGDANQAIYGFRGASPANIARFQEDYSGAVILPLNRNYRSRPDIVQLAEAFRWHQLELGEEVDTVANRGSNQPARLTQPETYVTVAEAADTANELAGLIADIRDKHASGYAYRDMAILCRTRARMEKITHALLAAELPAIEKVSVLEQAHSKDLLAIVLLMADTSGMGILRAAHQPEHRLSQSDIEALLAESGKQPGSLALRIVRDEAPATMSIAGRHALTRLASILQSLYQHASNVWSILAQYLFIETTLVRDLLTAVPSKQQQDMLADYSELLQLARRYDALQETERTRQAEEAEARGEQQAPSLSIQEQAKGFLDYIQVMLSLGSDSGGNRQQESGDAAEEAPDIIRVMTVHASKGLEFPIVYLPGLVQRNFPMQRHANPVPAPVDMLPATSDEMATHEIGEACLFYVGVTRARDQLILSYSKYNGKQKAKRSQYLETLLAGIPPERVRHLQWQLIATAEEKDTGEDENTAIVLPYTQPSNHFIEKMKPDKLLVPDIESYQRCPRRYLYNTIYGFRSEQGAYLLFWQAMQKTLESLQERRTSRETNAAEGEATAQNGLWPTREEALELYTRHWQTLGGQQQLFAAIYEQSGHEVTALLHKKLEESGSAQWELRPSYTVEAAGRTIHVQIDRVEASPQGERPISFVRTHVGKRKETPAVGTRELLYAHLSRQQAKPQKIEMVFHNLSTGETLPLKISSRKEQNLLHELEQAIRGLEGNDYPALFNARTCPQCPFYLICPA